MLNRIDWSIISAFRRAEGSSQSGVKQSKNTEQTHPYDKGTATVRKFGNYINYKTTRHIIPEDFNLQNNHSDSHKTPELIISHAYFLYFF
jgi:hypothetical protein